MKIVFSYRNIINNGTETRVYRNQNISKRGKQIYVKCLQHTSILHYIEIIFGEMMNTKASASTFASIDKVKLLRHHHSPYLCLPIGRSEIFDISKLVGICVVLCCVIGNINIVLLIRWIWYFCFSSACSLFTFTSYSRLAFSL